MDFGYCRRGENENIGIKNEKYVFGLKIDADYKTIIVRVTPKEDWIKYKKYKKNISSNLKSALNYLGYDFEFDEEFQGDYSGESLADIIKSLNKCPLLEYNDEFNDFVLTYLYCIHENADGEQRLYVTPKIYWYDNECQDDRHADKYIYNFLDGLGFDEEAEGVFESIKKIDYDKLKDDIKSFKYLEYSKDFDDFMDDVY